MANHKSSKKRVLVTEKRRLRNRDVRNAMRTDLKRARTEIDAGNGNAEAVSVAVSAIAKAGSKGVLHKRTAARRVSRLMKAANKSAK